jgi:predicted glycogen debranching enzyme
VKVGAEDCRHLDRALSLEWLETNGRGGFASGTVAGATTRRYHALLLTARRPPSERVVLVNQVEDWLDIDGQVYPLATNLYPGAIHPDGYLHCTSFELSPWPTWTYRIGGAAVQRQVCCVQGRDLVLLRWSVKGTPRRTIRLHVRPKLTGRDYHALHHENEVLRNEAEVHEGLVEWQPYRDLPAVRAFHAGTYRHAPEWYRRIELPIERQRGLDYEEDWWAPGEFTVDLPSGTPAHLLLTTEPVPSIDVGTLVRSEKARRRKVQTAISTNDRLAQRLWLATEAYICERGSGQTVIAGYPWFTDWGRDTFIALPGLCLVTGRYGVARRIIDSFAAHVSEGMIPNRFPDAGEQPEYNTIDASLWFIHAVGRYLAYAKDVQHVRKTAWPAVKQIIEGYRTGTRYGIRMDHDGLIEGGVPGVQLTWMDAKVGDWVVTPRRGKPVEIQALWIQALEIASRLATQFREVKLAERCGMDRRTAMASFQRRFWYEAGGYLYDVIDGPGGDDPSLRPNQLYALALCPGLLPNDRAKQVLRVVEDHLLTPVGLRTLSPRDDRYRGHYHGGPADRDAAYHQGTVWPFLLGCFVTAWLAVHGKRAGQKAKARGFLAGLEPHLDDACLGQVSEIFEGDAPHAPRGCPAQAWSVAEPLRALIEDIGVAPAASRRKGSR